MVKSKIKLALFITLPAILISLLAVEIILRLWWGDKPNSDWSDVGKVWVDKYVQRNEMGFRGRLPSKEKAPHTLRIVAIGDSITFGKGIEREEDRYPELLAKKLAALSGKKVEAINFGIPMNNTVGEHSVLKNKAIPYNPDVVILGYGYNDPESFEQIKQSIKEIKVSLPVRVLAVKSYLAFFVLFRLKRQEFEDYFIGYHHMVNDPDSPNMPPFRKALKGIVDLSRKSGAKFAAVIFPTLYRLEIDPYEFQDAHDMIVGEFKSLDVPYADLLPLLKGKNGRHYWVSSHDAHPDERVHEMAADELLKIVGPLIEEKPAAP